MGEFLTKSPEPSRFKILRWILWVLCLFSCLLCCVCDGEPSFFLRELARATPRAAA